MVPSVYLTHKDIIDNIVKDKTQINFIEKDYSSDLDGGKSGEILKILIIDLLFAI